MEYYTKTQAAKQLGVTLVQLEYAIRKDYVAKPKRQLGGQVYYNQEDLKRLKKHFDVWKQTTHRGRKAKI